MTFALDRRAARQLGQRRTKVNALIKHGVKITRVQALTKGGYGSGRGD